MLTLKHRAENSAATRVATVKKMAEGMAGSLVGNFWHCLGIGFSISQEAARHHCGGGKAGGLERDIFAVRLREARMRRQMRPTVLSELAGLDRNAVADYEGRRRVPNIRALRSIALTLEVSADWLLGMRD